MDLINLMTAKASLFVTQLGTCITAAANCLLNKSEEELSENNENNSNANDDVLDTNELAIETSGRTFIPKGGKPYKVQFDVNEVLQPKESDKFKDQQGNPSLYWPISVEHENGKLQTWNTNKTNALLVNEIKRGMKDGKFGWGKILRHTNAQNKTTGWEIEGIP
jgi:hypothetical protein